MKLHWDERLWTLLRGLRRSPGFATLAITVLGLGLGVAGYLYAVVHAYLVRPLPFPEPDRIVSVSWEERPGVTEPAGLWSTDWSDVSSVFAATVHRDLDAFTVLGGEPEVVLGAWVSRGFFDTLGVRPALGRPFDEQDLAAGSALAVISDRLWRQRFGADPGVLGRPVSVFVSDRPDEPELLTVVGVLPADFWWMAPYNELLASFPGDGPPSMARLQAGVDPALAERSVTEMLRAQLGSLPEGWQVKLVPLQESYTARLRPLLLALLLTAALVLLVATANVLLLVLVRAVRRERELAVRAVLAGGWRGPASVLAAEGLALATGAALVGGAAAWIGAELLDRVVQSRLGRVAPGGAGAIVVDAPVMLAMAATAGVLGLLLGLLPLAGRARRGGLAERLRTAGATGHATGGGARLRHALVSAEIALSLALLAAGGLAVRSALLLQRAELGYHPEGVVLAGAGLRQASYPDAASRAAFGIRLLERLRALPGVEAAAVGSNIVHGPLTARSVEAEGRTAPAGWRAVSPGYFETLGIALHEGRGFDPFDRLDGAPVAIVSADLARRLFPEGGALGARLRVTAPAWALDDGQQARRWHTIVGVAAKVRETLTGDELPEVYVPFAQNPSWWIGLAVRTDAGVEAVAPALRSAAAELDPNVGLNNIRDARTLVGDELAQGRFLAGLLGGLSLFGLLLGTIGLYGVVAHAVGQRLPEMALRSALGAAPDAIVRLFLADGARWIAFGVAGGIGAGIVLVRALASRLHGTAPDHLPTWCAVVALLVGTALGAIWLPARRALQADPVRLLRAD
jgi:putative ABC transport system permease protein